MKDIAYLGPERLEKMDAYLPSDAFPGPHPAILLIHGGGWRINDKADPREVNIGTHLAKKGYAVFSINYLLNEGYRDENGKMILTKIAWPQNFYDCKSGLRFLCAKAAEYNINPDRIATMGGSAGGHLAMLVGSTILHEAFNREGLYTDQSNEVSCILTLYGEFDLRARPTSPMRGRTAEETARNEHDASPVNWINQKTPPMFIAHGSADTLIPVERSRLLAQHLERMGVEYWYVEISGAPHTFDLHPEQMNLEPTILSFLQKHL
ncbi:MAG: alpha/beta hydrolase [Kiritimatiellia bacterium]